jgi:hypothetical protein
MKDKIEQLIKAADISQTDWDYDILSQISDLYARGYITARLERFSDSFPSDSEDFRDEFLRVVGFNVWGKA